MILSDVNVLVYAYRPDATDHGRFRDWLMTVVNGREVYGVSDLILSSFVRVVTSLRIFNPPTPLEPALEFCDSLRNRPNAKLITPGPHHWEIFADLCVRAQAKGALITDAYLAALAIEADCEWITIDRDFARFPGLRWRHPF